MRTFIQFSLVLGILCINLQIAKPTLADETKTVPVFKDGQAQVVPGFADEQDWVRHDLFVETEFDSDGDGKMDRMHVSVARQKQTETEGLKVPVIYVTSPYFAGTLRGREVFWNVKHELNEVPPERTMDNGFDARNVERPIISKSHEKKWIPRGYAVIHSSSPGTGLSQGCPTIGGKNESLAPKAVIDWLCGRAKGYTEIDSDEEVFATWCSGKVGMTGTSYNGTLPLAAATTGVEGLEAIIPIAPNTSYYHYYRSNGLVRHPGGYLGEDIDVLYEFVHSGTPERRDWCNCNVRDELMSKNLDRVTGDYNDFWAGRDYLNQLDDMKAALLMSHAFNDWNVMPEHSVRILEAARKNGVTTQAYFHQFGHGGPPPIELMNRWFTRFLHGVENGVEDDPQSWIVREGDKMTEPTAYPSYPHPEAQPVTFDLGESGTKTGKLSLATGNKGTTSFVENLVDDVQFDGKTLATAEASPNRLLYCTPELAEPLHISGYMKFKIRVASSKPAANLSVWVVSLPWDNAPRAMLTNNIITRGWADPQNSKSLTESEPLTPGKPVDLEFALQPDDQIIPAGQKIGLMIFSSDKDFTLHPKAGTVLSVDLSATQLTIPVVGGEQAISFKK